MITKQWLSLALMILLLFWQSGCGQDATKKTKNNIPPLSNVEAENLFRAFFDAVAESDETRIRELAVAAPGVERLWNGALWNGDTTTQLLETKRKILSFGNCRELSTGDRLETVDGGEIAVPPGIITDTRKMYVLEMTFIDDELWIDVIWSEGRWKVNAESILRGLGHAPPK